MTNKELEQRIIALETKVAILENQKYIVVDRCNPCNPQIPTYPVTYSYNLI